MTFDISNTTGNSNLISEDEGKIADILKENYLPKVNSTSKDVSKKDTLYTRVIKRIIDIIISLPVFCFLLPFNLVFGICTFFDVGRPIFYKQTRVGKDGKPFSMIKFRNMKNTVDDDGNLLPASQRVTKFGKFMRKYSLDELLNFWNVIKGDMSIIGPRPLPIFFYERMSDRHTKRDFVRPGLECPRMIEGSEEELGYYQLQFENDIWYVENVSLKTDLRMAFALIKMVFTMNERSKHASVGTYFVGYDEHGKALSMRMALEEYPDILKESKGEISQ